MSCRTVATAFLLLAGLLPGQAVPAPRTPVEALRLLGGTWTGDGLSLTFNAATLQVNDDPAMPFSWRSFRLVNASGSWIIFDIGGDRYFGLVKEPGSMTVTSSRFAGERMLRHEGR